MFVSSLKISFYLKTLNLHTRRTYSEDGKMILFKRKKDNSSGDNLHEMSKPIF